MREIDVNKITEAVNEIFSKICFCYDKDTKEKLITALDTDNSLEKSVLTLLLENEESAIENHVPFCQDTGMAVVYLQIGQDVHFTGGSLEDAINQGVRQAYQQQYLRLSVVADPLFARKNTSDNTPALIHYEIIPGDKVVIQGMAKGFGSENASAVYMLSPSASVAGVKDKVISLIREKGANACPPITVGIGIGGSMDMACWLAKKALLRKEEHNADERYQQLEEELLTQINLLNIGPAGLHGKTTCLKVAIEEFPTHIAGLPLAININCHAVRKMEVTL